MTDAKYTPGSWRLRGPDEFGDFTVLPTNEGLAIAAVVNGEMRRYGGLELEHIANASLIAAAPDLLEAAKNVTKACIDSVFKDEGPSFKIPEIQDAIVKLQETIDKVEGK